MMSMKDFPMKILSCGYYDKDVIEICSLAMGFLGSYGWLLGGWLVSMVLWVVAMRFLRISVWLLRGSYGALRGSWGV